MRQVTLAPKMAFVAAVCWPLSVQYVRSFQVQFQIEGESLDASERANVANFAHEIISLGHCFESVWASGSIDLSERRFENPRALAERRAVRVAALLRLNGIEPVGSSAPPGPPWVPNCHESIMLAFKSR